jgi:hypothetical protein
MASKLCILPVAMSSGLGFEATRICACALPVGLALTRDNGCRDWASPNRCLHTYTLIVPRRRTIDGIPPPVFMHFFRSMVQRLRREPSESFGLQVNSAESGHSCIHQRPANTEICLLELHAAE